MNQINIDRLDNNTLKVNNNNNDINVCITDIPMISKTSVGIFKTFGTNTSVKLTHKLQAKAETLNTSIQNLHKAKSEDTKNKILTTLRSAFTVAVLVGGILGTIAMAWCLPAAIGIGIATFIAYTALCYYSATCIGIEFKFGDQYYEPFMAWLGGPFFPLYEGFGQVSRLEKQVQTQKNEIESSFKDLISFFKHDHGELEKTLTQEIDKLKSSLEGLKKLPLSTVAGEKEIQEKLQKHERALSELIKAQSFYPQFHVSE